jgi:hypothetical protein
METTMSHSLHMSRGAPYLRRPGFGRRVFEAMFLFTERRALRDLDPHLLADIGITRDEAVAEASRPIWDVPDRWRR